MRFLCFAMTLGVLATSACGSSEQSGATADATSAAPDASAPDATATGSCADFESPVVAEERTQLEIPPADLRDYRYCEVLLTFEHDGVWCTEVYNSLSFNDCPEAAWYALDAETLKNEFGAFAVTLNGPRHWVINGATGASLPADAKIASFGSLQMLRAATIQSAIGEAAVDNSPYSPIEVQRTNTFNFTTDNEVYELVTDTGETYIMQSYSRIIDVDQSIDDLASLGTRLTLPQGWMFRARVLQDDFDLVTDGLAVVVVDDLSNTYQLIP